MVKFGISIYSVSDKIMAGTLSPEDGIKTLADYGAECVEIVPFGIDMIGDPGLIDRCLAAAASSGTKIENYSLNANFLQITEDEYKAEFSRVLQYMDVAEKLGCGTMRVDCSSFRRPIETNTTENFIKELPTVIDTYEKLCEHAEKKGLTILLENHGFHINGSERTAAIFSLVKSRNFGGQLDAGNFVCVDDPAEIAVKKNIKYAKTVHLKDFYIRPEDRDPGDATQFECAGAWFRSVNGKYLRGSILAQGDLDIYSIIGTIKHSDFDGNIYIEYEGMEESFYGTKVSFDNMKRIWQKV